MWMNSTARQAGRASCVEHGSVLCMIVKSIKKHYTKLLCASCNPICALVNNFIRSF